MHRGARLLLAGAAVALLLLAGLGAAALYLIGGAGCASTDTARATDGAWRIAQRSCGATVGFIWRVHVVGTDGRERLAAESYAYPEFTGAAVAGEVLRLSTGEGGRMWEVALDAQRRPRAPLHLNEGARR
ncbi:hypothetical protein J5Y09_12940 [Roseomonas sp. PWR1]|uniref:Uncharacterized protein n=1 Tax=Roseomonas nitratireducens TaxID=2820810 RepID=A0ABS4ATY1_9PROT|nr:hypothetical protein [Neoroseomonas nitratireducens]MBP0464820.1 hypothetical protein [Neoroseomonas nitratireducens]